MMKTAVSYVLAGILALTGIGGSSAAAVSVQTQAGVASPLYEISTGEGWDADPADGEYPPEIELDKTTYQTRDTIRANLLSFSPDTAPAAVEIVWLKTGNVVYFGKAEEASLAIDINLHPGNYLLRVHRNIDWSPYWDEYWNTSWNESWSEDWEAYWAENSSSVGFSVVGTSNLLRLTGSAGVEMRSEKKIVLSASLEWDGLPDGGPYTVIRRDEHYEEGQTVYFNGIYGNHFVDEGLLSGGVYTYTVSDGKKSSNPVVIDLGGLPPLEFPSLNNKVIVLKVNDPYMYSAKNKQSGIDGIGLEILGAIDKNDHGVTPVIINDRTMIPVASLVEKMGGSVKWDAESQVITISMLDSLKLQDNILEIPIGSKAVYFNGTERIFDTPARIKYGRTLVPIRLLELLGCDVEWVASEKSVVIFYWEGEDIE